MNIRNILKKSKNLLSNLLFPPKCANCGRLLDIDLTEKQISPLCPDCRAHFESEKAFECDRCGLAMPFCRCMPKNMERAQCTALLKLTAYRPKDSTMQIRNFLYSVKHSNERVSFEFFAEQMRHLIITEMRASGLSVSDCVITYLPRSRKNKAEAGFDQSFMLARALAENMGIAFVPCFKRRIASPEQKKLNRVERRLNMNSAYAPLDVSELIADKTVILVDDIVTTGAGMASCARLAYAMGAYAVLGVCIGRTVNLKRKNKNKSIK